MKNGLPIAGEAHILDHQHRGIQRIAGKLTRQLAIFYSLGKKTGCQMIDGRIAFLPEELEEWFRQARLDNFIKRIMIIENP